MAYHAYYPFGEEATAFNQDSERMKFTGHERDLHSLAGPGDDLDYMHARFCSPTTGRFLSVDPIEGRPDRPQTWNRYSYTANNPLNYIDPTGLLSTSVQGRKELERSPGWWVLNFLFVHTGGYVADDPKGGGPPDLYKEARSAHEMRSAEINVHFYPDDFVGPIPEGEIPIFVPPGASVGDNMAEASSHRYNLIWFYSQVRNKGPWDYKQ